VDHGKTTLTGSLDEGMAEKGLAGRTAYDQIERRRRSCARGGINDCDGAREYQARPRHYAHVDLPGAEGNTEE